MHILFVCGMNKKRSPTAEAVFRNDSRIQVRSAGVSPSCKNRITVNNIQWADLILVMEAKYKDRIVENFRGKIEHLPRISSLMIPDEYEYMDPELVELIKASVDPYIKASISKLSRGQILSEQ